MLLLLLGYGTPLEFAGTMVLHRLALVLLSASLYFSVVTSLVVGRLVVTRMHCGQTVHPRPIVTMEH